MKPRELAYKIAGALQRKLKTRLIGLRIEHLSETSDKLLFEYTITEGGKASASTAYSQSFFESEDKSHASWLASRIYTELTQRFAWTTKGNDNERHAITPTDAGRTNEESGFKNPTISNVRLPKNRRNTRGKRTGKASK